MAAIDLQDRVAIVTGAGGGLGGAMTLSLAGAGARVVAVDVAPDALDALLERSRNDSLDARIRILPADLADPAACSGVIARTLEVFGAVDVLVNNAGVGMQAIDPDYSIKTTHFWEAPVEGWQKIIDVNTRAPFLLARAAVPAMLRRGWGRIVNVTTSFDTMLTAGVWAYGQSKAALEAATASWAPQLADKGVTVNILVPGGPANTGLIPANSPFPRDKLIDPSVMRAPIRWLASNDSDGFTNRRMIAIDWNEKLEPREAAERASAPAAWPGFGRQARQPS